jgi:hypothetical protein
LVENKFYTSATAYGFKKGLTKNTLPIEYQQIEYIESDGTQYIDTGFMPNQNSSVEIYGYQIYRETNSLFGVNPHFVITSGGAKYRFRYNNTSIDTKILSSTLVKIALKKNEAYINDELIGTFETGEFQATHNALLFGRISSSGTAEETKASRIYYVKIWDNNALVRNFIPCFRKEDDVVGMYDLIENKFYISETESNFIKGPGYYKQLPEEYQKVEYIEANGTQYIDMQYTYKINDEINISFMKTQDTPNVIQGVFGNGNLTPYIGTVLYINGTNILTSTIGGALGVQFYKYEAEPIQNDKIYNVKYETDKVYVNGNHVITATNGLADGTQSDFSLFRRWGTNGFYGRIYSFNIIRDGKAIFNMVPCYRKSDGAIGMYDLSFGVFYQNSGTGEFLKGADKITSIENPSVINYRIYGNSVGSGVLPAEYQHVEYIESTGTQHIDTKVPLREGLKMVVDWVYNDADSGNSYTGAHIGSPGHRWLIGSQRTNGRYYFAVAGVNLPTEFKFGNRDIVEAYWKSSASYIKVNGVESTLND